MLYDYLLQNFTYLLQNFTGDDEIMRPSLCEPPTQNGFVYATDGAIIIKVPCKLCKKEYKITEKRPDYESVFPEKLLTSAFKKIITTNDFLKIITKMKIVVKRSTTPCKKCEAKGYKECECCGQEYDCEKCQGTGKIDDPNGFMIKDVRDENDDGEIRRYILIDGCKIQPKYAEIILFTMLSCGEESASLWSDNDKMMFRIGELVILVMTYD